MPKQKDDASCNYYIVGVFDFLGQSKRLRSVYPDSGQLLADPDEQVLDQLVTIAAIPFLTPFFFQAALRTLINIKLPTSSRGQYLIPVCEHNEKTRHWQHNLAHHP